MSNDQLDPSGSTEAFQAFVNRTEAQPEQPAAKTNIGMLTATIVVGVLVIGALFYFLATR